VNAQQVLESAVLEELEGAELGTFIEIICVVTIITIITITIHSTNNHQLPNSNIIGPR
jgi:hypothetical protein